MLLSSCAAAAEAVAVADADVQRLVGAELHAARERRARVLPCVGDEDLLHVDELRAVQAAARHAERLELVVALQVRDVHEPIRREVGVHDDAVQDVVAGRRRRSPNRIGQQLAALDHAQLAVALGDEQIRGARNEHEVPRRDEAIGHERDAKLLPPGPSRQRRTGFRQRERRSRGRLSRARSTHGKPRETHPPPHCDSPAHRIPPS